MAVPTLKHYTAFLTTTNLTTVATATPAARALVVSKIVIVPIASCNMQVFVGANVILYQFPLAVPQVYTETGVVAVAGETISFKTDVASSVYVHVFGEEVDS